VPTTPDRFTAIGGPPAWLPAILVGSGLLAGGAQQPVRTGAAGEDARGALVEHYKQGPIRAVVRGNPFGMDRARLDNLVTRAMAEGVAGLKVSFTSIPEQAAISEPHLVVILDAAQEPPAAVACRAPDSVTTLPASDRLSVFAVFCQGDQPLDAVGEEDRVAGPTDRNFQRLLWRTSAALFPDDYAKSYGFGILPNWLGIGAGGSFGL
jgi:hypothetical protein